MVSRLSIMVACAVTLCLSGCKDDAAAPASEPPATPSSGPVEERPQKPPDKPVPDLPADPCERLAACKVTRSCGRGFGSPRDGTRGKVRACGEKVDCAATTRCVAKVLADQITASTGRKMSDGAVGGCQKVFQHAARLKAPEWAVLRDACVEAFATLERKTLRGSSAACSVLKGMGYLDPTFAARAEAACAKASQARKRLRERVRSHTIIKHFTTTAKPKPEPKPAADAPQP